MMLTVVVIGGETPYMSVKQFNNPTLYYENYGSTRFIEGYYKIITYVPLEDYMKKYEDLGIRISNLTSSCSVNSNENSLCSKYQTVLTQLFNEIQDQKEKLFMSLGETDDKEEPKNTRKKRGLLNVFGTGMHYLFGICDYNCVTETNDAIERTEKSGKNTLHLMKEQTTIVKRAIKEMSGTLTNNTLSFQEVQEHEKAFMRDVSVLANETSNIIKVLNANSLQNMYTLLTNQYAYETSTLVQIVTAARSGIIHPSLLTIKEISKIIADIKPRIDGDKYEFPLGTRIPEVYELLKIAKLTIFFKNNKLIIVAKIPLVTSQDFVMYNTIPFPRRQRNKSNTTTTNVIKVIEVESPFIAITKDRREYVQVSEIQINNCHETTKFRICPSTSPRLINNYDTAPCEVRFFRETTFTEGKDHNCKIREGKLKRSIFHKLKYSNEWLFSVIEENFVVTCIDVETNTGTFHDQGIIKLVNTKCQIKTEDFILTPQENIQIETRPNFFPKTNMSDLFKINENSTIYNLTLEPTSLHADFKFTDLHKVTKSLNEINGLIEAEEYRQNNEEKTKHHSLMLYVALALGLVSLVLFFVIYIIVKSKVSKVKEVYATGYALRRLIDRPPSPR